MLHRPAFLAFAMTLAAIAFAVTASLAVVGGVGRVWLVGDRDWLAPHFFDGRFRLFWVRATDPNLQVFLHSKPAQLRIEPDGVTRQMLRGQVEQVRELANDLSGPPAPRSALRFPQRDIRVGIGGRRNVPMFALQFGEEFRSPWASHQSIRISFARIPDWLIPATMLIYPIYAVIRGPMLGRRRKRQRLCENCGYNLRALVQSRCPECGAEA